MLKVNARSGGQKTYGVEPIDADGLYNGVPRTVPLPETLEGDVLLFESWECHDQRDQERRDDGCELHYG